MELALLVDSIVVLILGGKCRGWCLGAIGRPAWSSLGGRSNRTDKGRWFQCLIHCGNRNIAADSFRTGGRSKIVKGSMEIDINVVRVGVIGILAGGGGIGARGWLRTLPGDRGGGR